MLEATTSPAQLVKKINACSEEFLSCIPDWSDTPPETPVNPSTRETHTKAYKEQIEALLGAAPTVKLAPEHLSDKDYNGVILYFHVAEDRYLKKKKEKEELRYRPEQREGKYIKLLRTTLYNLLREGLQTETSLKQVTSVATSVAPTVQPVKKISNPQPRKKSVAAPTPVPVAEKLQELPSTEIQIVEPTPVPTPIPAPVAAPVKVPTIQLDETERATIQALLEQVNALELTEVKSWATFSDIKMFEELIQQYLSCQKALTLLIKEVESYITPQIHEERTKKLEACTTPLAEKPVIFKASQQKGNGVYKNLASVKRKLTELCKHLLGILT